jgi:hypothetical protein
MSRPRADRQGRGRSPGRTPQICLHCPVKPPTSTSATSWPRAATRVLPCPVRGPELVVYRRTLARSGTPDPGLELNTGAAMTLRDTYCARPGSSPAVATECADEQIPQDQARAASGTGRPLRGDPRPIRCATEYPTVDVAVRADAPAYMDFSAAHSPPLVPVPRSLSGAGLWAAPGRRRPQTFNLRTPTLRRSARG